MRIHLRIDRLILDGFPERSVQAPAVKTAMEAELTRLLRTGGLSHDLQAGVSVPQVRATVLPMARDGSPRQLGTQIARSVYGGIGKPK